MIVGAGGIGKGTLAAKLVERDPRLWLSRSWTTRARRPHERDDAYTFVDRAAFMEHVEADGFMEWAETLGTGNLYGTPWPEVPEDRDLLLEIDVQGASQVLERHPDALVILLLAPSREAQQERLRRRGDNEADIARRVTVAPEEEEAGRHLAQHVVVNDDLERAVAEVEGLVATARGEAL